MFCSLKEIKLDSTSKTRKRCSRPSCPLNYVGFSLVSHWPGIVDFSMVIVVAVREGHDLHMKISGRER